MGTVYLIHFDRPYKHARHYVGFTDNLRERIDKHAAGDGARLMRVIVESGIRFQVARTWEGDRSFERRLKRRKNTARLCPVCKAEKAGNHEMAAKIYTSIDQLLQNEVVDDGTRVYTINAGWPQDRYVVAKSQGAAALAGVSVKLMSRPTLLASYRRVFRPKGDGQQTLPIGGEAGQA